MDPVTLLLLGAAACLPKALQYDPKWKREREEHRAARDRADALIDALERRGR